MTKKLTRGVRNNNPLNIRIGNSWQGEVERPTDKEFEQFKDMRWGIRAAFKLIRRYVERYGLNTVRKIIYRWAPPNENNTNAYILFVCHETGLKPDMTIRWSDKKYIMAIVAAMAKIESQYTISDKELEQGYIDAG